MATSTELEQRLADADRRLRRLAHLWRPVALRDSDTDSRTSSRGEDEPLTDALLERIASATAALQGTAVRDAADLCIMRALLADVSLVTAAFRHAVTAGGHALDDARAQVASVKPAMVARGEGDRVGTP